jgi:uncharacterized protein YcbX
MGFLIALLIGLLIGIVIVPIMLWIWTKMIRAAEKHRIKRELKNGRFLQPMDKKDYDVEMWKDKVNVDNNAAMLAELNDKVFKRNKYILPEDER